MLYRGTNAPHLTRGETRDRCLRVDLDGRRAAWSVAYLSAPFGLTRAWTVWAAVARLG